MENEGRGQNDGGRGDGIDDGIGWSGDPVAERWLTGEEEVPWSRVVLFGVVLVVLLVTALVVTLIQLANTAGIGP